MLTREELMREAAASGFQPEPLEKVIHLLELLEALRSHPFLKDRVALKGGTALNVFLFDLPRLSVDIDLNYIGAVDRDTMLEERPKVEQAVQAACSRLGIQIRRVPSEHAGGKWRLSFTGVSGRPSTLELDMNFMYRTPLWPPVAMGSRRLGSFGASQVPVLDAHELAAGKLSALFDRRASRDLFDAHQLLRKGNLDRELLRLGFVVYGGASRRDWRTLSIQDIQVDPTEVDRQLWPVLRAGHVPPRDELGRWGESLVADCRELASALIPFEENEIEFLTRLNDEGEITPEHLTDDERLREVIRSHPGLRWKALNARKHRGKG